jgi:site-specific DNA recombinase
MHGSAARAPSSLRIIRAAIYTRVSTDESLAMEFNSLDAQREACQAYIASQRHEGWTEIDARYDDGGYSGGTLKRPALERLLEDVRGGRIDTIVVYKIDRLTRSLADFSRIVDVLDAHDASFISITQAFSTTTSMGRLTLNVLLSFAQFEREVGAERVRDKIASSKRKGMWMGGVVPLGYDVSDRKLVVNNTEAKTVRAIFERYIELRSVTLLEENLRADGVLSKRHAGGSGKPRGGTPFTRGALYNLLRNVTYIGQVGHKGESHPGQQDAILDRAVFDKAQEILAANRSHSSVGARASYPSLLTGMLVDERGEVLSPSHSTKGTKRFRYYFARQPGDGGRRLRVPARELERLVITTLTDWLGDEHGLEGLYASASPDAEGLQALLFTARRVGQELASATPSRQRELLQVLVSAIAVTGEKVRITVALEGLGDLAQIPQGQLSSETPVLTAPCKLVRRSREVRLAVAPGKCEQDRIDPSLIKLAVKAHAARAALFAGEGASLADVARSQGHEVHYFAVLVKLSYLAPDLIEAILEGRQPLRLDRQALARIRQLPMDWAEQRTTIAS